MPSRAAVYSQQAERPFFGPARPPQHIGKSNIDRKPQVALLQLKKQADFDAKFAQLLSGLSAKANVILVTTEAQAEALFRINRHQIILATDQALAEPKHVALRNEARQFVLRGGTLIFCCHFPSLVHDLDAARLFSSFGLYWRTGECHRTEHAINQAARRINAAALTSRYSPEARHLRDVDTVDAIYLPATCSYFQSCVAPPSSIEDRSQTPAALTGIGMGKLGYLGDVHAEEGDMESVLLNMCGMH